MEGLKFDSHRPDDSLFKLQEELLGVGLFVGRSVGLSVSGKI